MHDIKAIRENPEAYDRAWARRGLSRQTPQILKLDSQIRAHQTTLQAAQSRRNEVSKKIGAAKKAGDNFLADNLMREVEEIKREMARCSSLEQRAAKKLHDILQRLPNLPAFDVPDGDDEAGNIELRQIGNPNLLPGGRQNRPRDHVEIGQALGGMDFEAAARMSGARFVVLRGQVARLERAIGQFMLDLQVEEGGYSEVSPPLLVKDEAMYGTGQLPKFESDLYFSTSVRRPPPKSADKKLVYDIESIRNSWAHSNVVFNASSLASIRTSNYERFADSIKKALDKQFETRTFSLASDRRWLIPTAEVSLTNLVREQITPEEELPLRLTALTPSFRSEAGASGRDTRGMIRQHQFYKVELVSITTPDQSEDEHQRMVSCAERVLERLGLAYRTMLLCAGDMGFGARKTYDLEVWLPSQNMFREISSCSNCGDFQARRMEARTKAAGEKGTRYVHTLNGSGLAVGRTLVAVLENYQDEGGRVFIPEVLQPYMGGVTHLEAKA